MVCPLFRLAAILLLVPCVANAADNWPAFRGPHGDGHADATGLPITFGETENVRWRTPIAGKAWSSPVVWGEQVWVTNATVDGKELSALCLNRNTGKIEKEIAVFHVEKPAFCHAFNSYASSTPVIEEGRLYAHYGSHGTACVDTNTGKILWTRQDFSCDHFRAAGSSPVLFQNLLIIPFDGVDVQYVVALDKLTGKTVWQRDRDIEFANNNPDFKKAYSTPSIVDVNGKSQLVIPAAMVTQSFDPLSGRPLWFVKHGGMNAAAKPVYDEARRLYFRSRCVNRHKAGQDFDGR